MKGFQLSMHTNSQPRLIAVDNWEQEENSSTKKSRETIFLNSFIILCKQNDSQLFNLWWNTNSVIEGFGYAMKTGQFKIFATISQNPVVSFKSASF